MTGRNLPAAPFKAGLSLTWALLSFNGGLEGALPHKAGFGRHGKALAYNVEGTF